MWVPSTHAGDPNGVLGSLLHSDPALAIGVNQHMRDQHIGYLSLPSKHQNTL